MTLTNLMTKKTNMDTLTMNKLWIEHSHYDAEFILDDFLTKEYELTRSDYLVIVGLFETNWMNTYFDQCERDEYGYPNNE